MIEIKNIHFAYGKCQQVISDYSFEFHKGELYTIMGASGCGKTTLLRLIAGLETLPQGEIIIDGELVSSAQKHMAPYERNIGFVFQDYSLFPHLNVRQNIAYGCKDKSLIPPLMEELGIAELEKKHVFELSGGQQQRVAIARSLATKPKILLLDEPFSNLDEKSKEPIKNLLMDLTKKYQLTVILVSHHVSDCQMTKKDNQIEFFDVCGKTKGKSSDTCLLNQEKAMIS